MAVREPRIKESGDHTLWRTGGRGSITPWLLAALGMASATVTVLWKHRSGRAETLNRRAATLYRNLAEREFGPIRTERACLPDEHVTRLVVPLRGEDIDREVDEALEREFAIHHEVQRIAPELVGRIVFDYSSNGRRT